MPVRLRKKYLNVSMLIIDEVGFQPMSRPEASLLFRLVSYRYQRGATLITINKAVKDWPVMRPWQRHCWIDCSTTATSSISRVAAID